MKFYSTNFFVCENSKFPDICIWHLKYDQNLDMGGREETGEGGEVDDD